MFNMYQNNATIPGPQILAPSAFLRHFVRWVSMLRNRAPSTFPHSSEGSFRCPAIIANAHDQITSPIPCLTCFMQTSYAALAFSTPHVVHRFTVDVQGDAQAKECYFKIPKRRNLRSNLQHILLHQLGQVMVVHLGCGLIHVPCVCVVSLYMWEDILQYLYIYISIVEYK